MNRWFILSLLFFARTAMAVHYIAVGAILPLLIRDLGLNYAEGGTLIGLFMLPGIVLALPGGYLGLWLGDKRLTLIGLGLMTVGGVVFGLSDTFLTLAIGRAFAGMGSAFLNVILYKMAGDWFEGREVSTATGLVATSWPLGMGMGLTTLAVLGVQFGWQMATLSVSALSLLAMLAVGRWYQNPPHVRRPADAKPSLKSSITGWEVLAANVSGVIRMFAAVGQSLFIAFTPAYLVTQGASITQAGFLVSICSWIMIGSTVLGGFAADRLRRPLTVILVGSVAFAALVMAIPQTTWRIPLFLALGLIGGLAAGPVNALPGQALRPETRSVGFGIFFTWTYLGQTVLPPLAGYLADQTHTPASALYFSSALTMLTLPALAAFAWVRRRRTRTQGGRALGR